MAETRTLEEAVAAGEANIDPRLTALEVGKAPVMPFGGALIRPTTSKTYTTTGLEIPLRFDEAVYDTDGFWSSQKPDGFTIPPGITKVRLLGAVKVDSSDQINQTNSFYFSKNDSRSFTGNAGTVLVTGGYSNPSGFIVSSVLDVEEGDYFEFQYSTSQSFALDADGRTWFAIEVIERNGVSVGLNIRLKDLIDANIVNPQAGQVLLWNSETGRWEPGVPIVSVNAAQGLNKPFRGAMAKFLDVRTFSDTPISPVIWDDTDYDTDNFWSASSPGRFTIPAGVTKVRLSACLDPDGPVLGSGNHVLQFLKNGQQFRGSASSGGMIGYTDVCLSITSPVIPVEKGDYFEVRYNKSGSGSITLDTNSYFALEVVEATEVVEE